MCVMVITLVHGLGRQFDLVSRSVVRSSRPWTVVASSLPRHGTLGSPMTLQVMPGAHGRLEVLELQRDLVLLGVMYGRTVLSVQSPAVSSGNVWIVMRVSSSWVTSLEKCALQNKPHTRFAGCDTVVQPQTRISKVMPLWDDCVVVIFTRDPWLIARPDSRH
jgi:hypothetical protein